MKRDSIKAESTLKGDIVAASRSCRNQFQVAPYRKSHSKAAMTYFIVLSTGAVPQQCKARIVSGMLLPRHLSAHDKIMNFSSMINKEKETVETYRKRAKLNFNWI